jgi:hypothetical protein
LNSRYVANEIASVCEALRDLGLVALYNSPCTSTCGSRQRVSYPSTGIAAHAHEFGSLEQYLSLLENGSFTCVLTDHSVIQASYDCDGNSIVGHSLLFWPSPIVPRVPLDGLDDIREAVRLCMESPTRASAICDLLLRSPMRFDFDPDRASEDHPEVHLHTQFGDTRIHVDCPMSFTSFVKMVFRTFFREIWNSNPGLAGLHEQVVPLLKGEFAPATHNLSVSWSSWGET